MASPVYGWRTPAGSDAPNGPEQLLNLAEDIEPQVIGQYATTTARDAAWPLAKRRAGMIAAVGTGAAMILTAWDGTTWRRVGAGPWQAFTPTWSGLTFGNAVTSGRYCRVGDTIHATYALTLGSTSAVTGLLYPSLPVAAAGIAIGTGWAYDDSAAAWAALTLVAGAYLLTGTGQRVTTGVPWAWANQDQMRLSITYEAGA